jgi:hypothetical protein
MASPLERDRSNHTIYVNPVAKKTSGVPRHNEINNDLARAGASSPDHRGEAAVRTV